MIERLNRRQRILLFCAVIVFTAAVAVGAVLIVRMSDAPAPPVTEPTVIVTVNGQEYCSVPLSRPQTVTISQSDGSVNVIEISDHGAVMRSANCDGQDCVHMGEVTTDNWEWRLNGAFIICLPHRVSVELRMPE